MQMSSEMANVLKWTKSKMEITHVSIEQKLEMTQKMTDVPNWTKTKMEMTQEMTQEMSQVFNSTADFKLSYSHTASYNPVFLLESGAWFQFLCQKKTVLLEYESSILYCKCFCENAKKLH